MGGGRGSAHIIAELGMQSEFNDDGSVTATTPVLDTACLPGTDLVRTSVLATWADVLTGMVCSHAILPRIPVTLDLEVQLVRPGHAGTTLDVVSRPVKLGRTVAVSDAQFFESSTGDLIATSLATFVASPDPTHVMPGGFPKSIPARTALGVPLAERVQRRIIEPGVVEMPRLPDGQNATGAIQGGLLAFSAEEAALSLVDEPAILTMLNIRYFRPFSIGPARATATRNGRVCNVQLVDAGSGKTGAVVTSRWAPLNSPEVADARQARGTIRR